jgi:uncharacterized protein
MKQAKKQLEEIAKTYTLLLLYRFGSQARGDAHRQSDTDLAYESKRNLSARARTDLVRDLRVALHITGDIDLVDIRTAPPLLQRTIMVEGEKIYGSDVDDDRRYRLAVKRAIDAKPLFEATQQYVQETIALAGAHTTKK